MPQPQTERTPRVLAVVDGMIPSVELVLSQPFDHLQAQGKLNYALHVISDPALPLSMSGFDALILMRVYQPQAMALAQAAEVAGIPLIYILDDDFSALDPQTPLGRHYADARAWERILGICAMARQVWTFSQALVDKVGAVQAHVVKLPAIANIELVDRLRAELHPPPQPAKVIGYAASLTHAGDLAAITRPLLAVLDAYPDWSIEIVNVDPGSLGRHARVKHFPGLPSVEQFYRFVMQRNWAIGLAPLLRTAANDAKTDNKYREYAALGISGIYSPAPPYAGSVAQGITGLYADGADEWVRAIATMIDDPTRRQGIVDMAREDVRSRYPLPGVAQRYLECLQAALRRPLQVIVIAPSAIPSVDIDIVRPFSRLQAEGLIDWTLTQQDQIGDGDLRDKDCAVIVRYSDPLTVDLMRRAREVHGVPTVYAWDDDFFSIPDGLGAITDYYQSPSTLDSLRHILREATIVKASTPRLAARSREYSSHVTVAPFGFDFDQLTSAGGTDAESADVVIGFFGSHSHGLNVALVSPVLARVAAEFPSTRFELFGPAGVLFGNLPRVTHLPWCASSSESINLLRGRGWSIGLAPFEDNLFNRTKLPTKYRDYSACGIAGVYSRIDPYADNVIEGVTGLLADQDPQSWYLAIRKLVEDADLRRRIASRAYLHVRDTLSVEGAVTAWRKIFVGLDTIPPHAAPAGHVPAAEHVEDRSGEQIAMLERRVRLLQISARLLLEQKRQLEGGKLGRLRRVVQRIRGTNHFGRDRSPAFAHFLPHAGSVLSSSMQLELSANLQALSHVEFAIVGAVAGCDVVEVAISLPVPTLPGMLTLEIISPDGAVILSSTIPLEDVDPFLPVRFHVGESLARAGSQGKLRFSTKGSFAPVFLFQMRHRQTALVMPFLGFSTAGEA
ncbi:MAG: glycosyltransferase [Betaproteobacteria bacterium]